MRLLKKSLFCLGLLLIAYPPLFSGAEPAPPVIALNGETKTFQHPPRVIDGRTFLPMRETFEALDAVVHWNPQTRTVTATKGERTVQLAIGSTEAYVDHRPVYLELPARIIHDTTFVPLRFVGQALGATISWDEQTRTVSIATQPTLDLIQYETIAIWHDDLTYRIKWLHELLIDFKNQMDEHFDPTRPGPKKDRFELAKEIDEQYRDYRIVLNRAKENSRANEDAQAYLRQFEAAVEQIKDAIRLSSRYREQANEHFENAQTIYDRMTNAFENEMNTLIQKLKELDRNAEPFSSDERRVSFQLVAKDAEQATVHLIVPPTSSDDGYTVTYRMTKENGEWTIAHKSIHRSRAEEEDLIRAIERKYRNDQLKDVSVKRFQYDPNRGAYEATVFSSSKKGGWNAWIDPYAKQVWERSSRDGKQKRK